MAKDETPSAGGKLLEIIPGITALVVAVSFALGSASLFGRTFALGSSASEFLSVSDLATATVRHSPFAIIALAAMTLFELVLVSPSSKPAPVSFPQRHYRAFLLALWAATVVFWTVRPSIAASLILLLSLPLLMTFTRVTSFKVDQGAVPSWALIGTILMGLVGIGFLNSYQKTINQVVGAGSRTPKATHSICIEDDCRPGLLVARLAEISVVRWVPEKALDYIPNDRISRVTIAEPVADRPIFNVWGWLRNAWGWTSTPKVTETPPPSVPLTSSPP